MDKEELKEYHKEETELRIEENREEAEKMLAWCQEKGIKAALNKVALFVYWSDSTKQGAIAAYPIGLSEPDFKTIAKQCLKIAYNRKKELDHGIQN